jgi:hypothetical protein
MFSWKGRRIELHGLVGAAALNGRQGVVQGPASQGRFPVHLPARGQDAARTLSVKEANLLDLGETVVQLPADTSAAKRPKTEAADDVAGTPKERTLKRDTGILQEFDASEDPDLMVLYHHFRDQAFDCFNASEYHKQMVAYYGASFSAVEVVSRRIARGEYLLVCLRHKEPEKNTLCEVAFQCQRQFVGISMLMKRRCFVCHNPTAKKCSVCKCACYCSKACLEKGYPEHKALCKLIKAGGAPSFDADPLQVEL